MFVSFLCHGSHSLSWFSTSKYVSRGDSSWCRLFPIPPVVISQCTKKAIVILMAMNLDIVIQLALFAPHPKGPFQSKEFQFDSGKCKWIPQVNVCSNTRERIGGLCCRVLSQSTTTTRPSKHTESFYSLTVLPPATTPPRGCCFLSLPLEWWQQWMRRHDYFFQTQKKEASFMPHWLCFLWLIFPFSSLPTSRPPKPCAHTQTHIFLSTQPSPLDASPFWWWFWHAGCHAAILWKVAINRAVAIWGEINRQNPT